MSAKRQPDPAPLPTPQPRGKRWLLLVHQLPSSPSNLRVRTWRRLQQLGAIPVKQAVYVLPDTPAAREDFEWLRTEIEGAGGEATVFTADHVDTWSDDVLVETFRRSRQDAYGDLARDIQAALKRAGRAQHPRGRRAPAVRRLSEIFRERLLAIEAVDFFGSAGRDHVLTLLAQLENQPAPGRKAAESSTSTTKTSYESRVWITRPRPGVDRMSSAWLIRRFIDPRARFAFAADRSAVPAGAVPFDMFGVEFSHRGDACTFETLCAEFAIDQPALKRIAAIVHDLDLKDERFQPPEAGAIAAMIEGLQLAHADDDELLAQGMTLFESLYRSFERASRSTGPRPLAKARSRRAAKTKSR